MPNEKPVTLPGIKGALPGYPKPAAQERELARELSTIMLVDQLMGQWDRFWKNLEATGDKDGQLHLFARDNGGATVNDWEWHANYDRWLSRYDREVVAKLRHLHVFLNGGEKTFAGFDDPETWQKAVGFRADGSFATFKQKLALLIDKRIPGLEKQYGQKVYFEMRTTVQPQAGVTNLPARTVPGPVNLWAQRLGDVVGAGMTQASDELREGTGLHHRYLTRRATRAR